MVPLFGAANAAPNKGITILYCFRSPNPVLNPPVNGKIQGRFKAFLFFQVLFQANLISKAFQDSPVNSSTFQACVSLESLDLNKYSGFCRTWSAGFIRSLVFSKQDRSGFSGRRVTTLLFITFYKQTLRHPCCLVRAFTDKHTSQIFLHNRDFCLGYKLFSSRQIFLSSTLTQDRFL